MADKNTWKRAGLPVVVACLVTLTACGSGGDEADGGEADGPDGTGAVTQSPTSDPVPGQPGEATPPGADLPREDAELVEGMTQEREAGWYEYEMDSESRLRLLVMSGNQSCYGQRYEIQETAQEVAVAVIVGWRDDAPEACTAEGVFVAVPVELDEPLGEREVVELEDPDLNS